MSQPEFIKKILDFIEKPQAFFNGNNELPESVVKFMGSYLTILWEIDPQYLKLARELFDLPRYKHLYMQSSNLFQKVMKQTKIVYAITEFAENVMNGNLDQDLEIPKNTYAEVLEQALKQENDDHPSQF